MEQQALQNKVAWITGSSRGIGRVIAEHLAGLGATVVIHGTGPTPPAPLGRQIRYKWWPMPLPINTTHKYLPFTVI